LFITEPSSKNILAFKLLDFNKIDCFSEDALINDTPDGTVSPRPSVQVKMHYTDHDEPYLEYK
jgi:hypothetical protein